METAEKTIWKIDPAHSEVQFKIKHLVISTVTGSFDEYDATVEQEGDTFEGADVQFEAETASVDTGNEQRDQHLRSDDFFNAEEYPKITFDGKSLEKNGDDEYELTGDLTIRDVTEEVTLDVVHGGTVEDHLGNVKAGFEISGEINRKNFGLNWDAVTEAGNLVAGEKVKLQMNVQFAQQ
jgi:polyisoprenoid-binding protein YceI